MKDIPPFFKVDRRDGDPYAQHQLQRSSFLLLALALSCLILAAAARAETKLEELLPQNAVCALIIENVPALVNSWQESAFFKMLNDDQIKRYLAPSLEKQEDFPWDAALKEMTGHTLQENLRLFEGSLIITLLGPDPEAPGAYFDSRPPILLLGEIGDNTEAFKAYATKDLENTERVSQADYEERTEDHLGETLYLRRKTNADGSTEEAEGWAIVNSVAVIAWPQDLLRTTVSSLKNPPSDASLPEDLKAHFERSGGVADIVLFANLAKFEPAWRARLATPAAQKFNQNPFGITLDNLLRVLAPEKITSLSASLNLDPKATHLDVSVGGSTDAGLLSLMTYINGELRQPQFIPANTMHAGSCRFDFGLFYDRLFDMAKTITPMFAGMIEGQLQGIESQVGINLRRDLIGGLGVDHSFFEDIRNDGPKQAGDILATQTEFLYAISLKNTQGVETALGAIRTFLGQGMAAFDERDFLGTKVFTYKMPTQAAAPAVGEDEENAQTPQLLPIEISHAVAGGYFFLGIGSQSPIERALKALHTPSNSLWQQPIVRKTLDAVGQDIAYFEYYNFTGMISRLLVALNQWQRSVPEGERIFNPDASPVPDTFSQYLKTSISLMRVEPSALYTRTTIHGSEE